jgi:hypothetical protein
MDRSDSYAGKFPFQRFILRGLLQSVNMVLMLMLCFTQFGRHSRLDSIDRNLRCHLGLAVPENNYYIFLRGFLLIRQELPQQP